MAIRKWKSIYFGNFGNLGKAFLIILLIENYLIDNIFVAILGNDLLSDTTCVDE